MLGLFKRMLSKQETLPTASSTMTAKPVATPSMARPAVSAKRPVTPLRVPLAPALHKPVQQEVQPRVVAPPPATSTHVHIALATIAASLPEAISHKVPADPEQFVPIPVEKVLPQLAHGQVVMTAAELRECSPDFFSALAGHDDIPVTLPLGDIVSQLSPQLFGRRSQRRLDVPAEVGPVFGGASSGGASVAKPLPSQPAQRVQPTVTSTTPSSAPAVVQAPAGRIAMSPQALASLGTNTKVSLPTRPATTAAPRPVNPIPAAPVTTPATTPSVPAATFSRTPITVPKKPAAPAKLTGELAVPLSSVCTDWIDEVRTQLIDVDVAQSQILVPLELLVPLMKSGRILFSWQEVAGWIQPPLTIPPTPKVGEMPVELPLKVIAPLFMANHRSGGQKRVTVDESIPDLFGGGDASAAVQPQAAAEASPPAAVPSVPAMPEARSTPAPVSTSPAPMAAAPALTMAQPAPTKAQTTQPTLRMAPAAPQVASAPVAPSESQCSVEQVIGPVTARFGAKEIVAKTARLPGAAGALLVMNDGLLVTSQIAPQFKSDTIAAFLPQMFGRMTQYTKELSLGSLDRITLSVESGEWHVFKTPNIYFAVLGKRGEALSLNLLAQVAAELSSQSK